MNGFSSFFNIIPKLSPSFKTSYHSGCFILFIKQLRAREAEDFQDTCARAADAAGLAIVHGVVYARDHVNGSASANGKH